MSLLHLTARQAWLRIVTAQLPVSHRFKLTVSFQVVTFNLHLFSCFALLIYILFYYFFIVGFLREWEMKCKVRSATRANLDRHTGVNLAVEVNDTMKDFGLKIVCLPVFYNAANVNLTGQMINGTKQRLTAFNIGCATHSLNLSIGDALKEGVDQPFQEMVAAARRLIGSFKMSSLATNGLRAKVKEMLASEHHGKGLIQDVSTRWNSTFYVLEGLSLLCRSVVAVLSDQSLTKPQEARVLVMPVKSWKLAEEIVPVLRKVKLVTVLFTSQSKTTSGVVVPAISGLVQQLKTMMFQRAVIDGRWRAATPPGQNFRDNLVWPLTDRPIGCYR